MAWQRGGDTASTYPPLMATRGDPASDERTINEVAGFVWRLSLQSGAHLTDYVLDVGTVELIGGPRTAELLRLCCKTGLLTKVRAAHGVGYRLVADPDFIHLRSRADVEWSRQQRADTTNLALVVPVRLRDGDQCRWCGVEVVWMGRKTARSAELDHLRPGVPDTAVETLVVACRSCNRARGGDVERWDSAHELRPAPTRPRFGEATATFLTRNGYPTEPTAPDAAEEDVVRPSQATAADTAPHQGVRPAASRDDDPAPSLEQPGESPGSVPRKSTFEVHLPGRVGSGSDGSGSSGPGSGLGSAGPGLGGAHPPGRRRRGRKRRRPGGGS